MKFSIIIPVYKAELFLSKCLESILAQTFTDFEVILCDDGSPDKSGQICDHYATLDSRVHVIHKTNGGALSARKNASEKARGDYICCVDSDDWIGKDYLKDFSDYIDLYPNVDVVCGGFTKVRKNKNIAIPIDSPEAFYSRKEIEDLIFPSLVQKQDASYFRPELCGKVIKRSLFLKFQEAVPKNLIFGEDRCCIIPLIYNSNSIVVSKKCDYFYRQNPNSIMNGKTVFSWNQTKIAADYLASCIDVSQFDFMDQLNRYIEHCLFTNITSFFAHETKFSVAKEEILEVLNDKYYEKAISSAIFNTGNKAKLMDYSLKTHFLFPIWIYSKIKKA